MKTMIVVGANSEANSENMRRLMDELLDTVKFEKIIFTSISPGKYGLWEWGKRKGIEIKEFDYPSSLKSTAARARRRNAELLKIEKDIIFVVAMRTREVDFAHETPFGMKIMLNFERWLNYRYGTGIRGLAGAWLFVPKTSVDGLERVTAKV